MHTLTYTHTPGSILTFALLRGAADQVRGVAVVTRLAALAVFAGGVSEAL